jgi:hypothetical protein
MDLSYQDWYNLNCQLCLILQTQHEILTAIGELASSTDEQKLIALAATVKQKADALKAALAAAPKIEAPK